MTKKETIIYLAGLLDGEGYFGVRKHKGSNPRYQEEIKVSMVESEPIWLMKNIFGGNISKQKGTNRSLFRYEASDKIAEKICKALLPYLIVKKSNAKVLLKMREHKNKTTLKNPGKKMTKQDVIFRERCFVECKKNNSPHLWQNQ